MKCWGNRKLYIGSVTRFQTRVAESVLHGRWITPAAFYCRCYSDILENIRIADVDRYLDVRSGLG